MMMNTYSEKQEREYETMMDILIKKYGFESEPVLYFGRCAEKDMYNIKVYFNTAINWHF